jgi:uncharacterized repeat protein (TIGR01451 family)
LARKSSGKLTVYHPFAAITGNMKSHITPSRHLRSRLSSQALLLAGIAFAVTASPVFARGTQAGTSIENTAIATFDGPGGSVQVPSNQVTVLVDELIDPVIEGNDPGDVVALPGATGAVHSFTLTNNGNGTEAFVLTAVHTNGGDDFDPTANSIVLDSNGNGVYDEGVDTVYVPGTNNPVLAPDASVVVFVLSNMPSAATDGNRGQVSLVANSATGTGAPGTSFAGAGEGGGNAVVGASGGTDNDNAFFVISSATIALLKSAVVTDPFGGNEAVPGSIITYTLTANAAGTGNVSGVVIADAIPAGTVYQPASMTLSGAALTDVSGDDAGTFSGTGISVNLGSVAGGTTQTVTFKVKIGE